MQASNSEGDSTRDPVGQGGSLFHTPSGWNELNFRIDQLSGLNAAIACLYANMGFNLGLSGGGGDVGGGDEPYKEI